MTRTLPTTLSSWGTSLTTNEELQEEIDKLKKRIESLELDVTFIKVTRIGEQFPVPYVPYQPWVAPSSPYPVWTITF